MVIPFNDIIVFLSSMEANMADIQKKRHKSSVFSVVEHVGKKAKRNNMRDGL